VGDPRPTPDRTPSPPRLRLAAGLILIAAVLCTACAHSAPAAKATPPSSKATAPSPASDAHRVCAQFASTALEVNTTRDAGPGDARRRAAQQFGVPSLPDQTVGEGRDPEWTELVAHHARVQASTSPVADDPAPPRGDEAGTGVAVSRVAVGSDGWHKELPETVAYCSLNRNPSGLWQVSEVTFSDSASSGTGGE
jgi:hypothetical protein